MPGDVILKTITDADFGRLDLIETRADAGDVWEPRFARSWMGSKDDERAFTLGFTSGEDPPEVADAMRACFRQTLAELDALRLRIARVVLPVLRRRAEPIDAVAALDEEAFADGLKLKAVEISANRLALFFAESTGFFGDSLIELRLSASGEILHMGLAG